MENDHSIEARVSGHQLCRENVGMRHKTNEYANNKTIAKK